PVRYGNTTATRQSERRERNLAGNTRFAVLMCDWLCTKFAIGDVSPYSMVEESTQVLIRWSADRFFVQSQPHGQTGGVSRWFASQLIRFTFHRVSHETQNRVCEME